jgi:hypothetical protein
MNALVPMMVLYALVAAAGFYFAGKERRAYSSSPEGTPVKGWPALPPNRETREGDRPQR